MIRPMKKRTMIPAGASGVCILALVACAGGEKAANAPSTCPEGTALKEQDCVPVAEPKNDEPAAALAPPAPSAAEPSTEAPPAATTAGSTPASPVVNATYDKDAVEVQLKRAARQIKANCGSATDEDGKAGGPWGTTKATVVLGRNGHVKQVTVPAPYGGRPVGVCAVHAFEKLWFPPYGGSTDLSVDWEIVITPPKHR